MYKQCMYMYTGRSSSCSHLQCAYTHTYTHTHTHTYTYTYTYTHIHTQDNLQDMYSPNLGPLQPMPTSPMCMPLFDPTSPTQYSAKISSSMGSNTQPQLPRNLSPLHQTLNARERSPTQNPNPNAAAQAGTATRSDSPQAGTATRSDSPQASVGRASSSRQHAYLESGPALVTA